MSLFTKIVQGEIPSYKVAENEEFYAFLDINPVAWGQTLVIPRREEDYLFDLGDDELARMAVFAKQVAWALKEVVPCKKIGVTVLGLEVPHAHIHLVPLQAETDMSFSAPKKQFTAQQMAELAAKVYSAYLLHHHAEA